MTRPGADILAVSQGWYRRMIGVSPAARAEADEMLGGLAAWPTDVQVATQGGTGADNPDSPIELTELQARRAVMVLIDGISAFQIRFSIHGCCGTGRKLETID